MKLFDSHCHLTDERFNDDRNEIIKKIRDEGIKNCICAGYNLESSIKSIELSKKYDFIYTAIGISPNDIPQSEEELWKEITQIKNLIQSSKKNIAIGEIGLDYHWETKNKDLQKKAFIQQIELANELNLPIFIHTRDAIANTLQILKEHPVYKKGVFHCCPLNRELVKEGLKLGFYISFAGPVTFKNSKNADEIISMVPNNKFLIETDSPYLAPEPVRGTKNIPSNVKYIVEKIANVKNLSPDEIAELSYKNTKNLIGS